LRLGALNLENNLILAPMQNITTGPYRRFCRRFHKIGLVCVPMLYSKGIANTPETLEYELHEIEKERPISIQLIGSESESIKKSIEYLESYKYDVLDINAGCPSKRAVNSFQGGYLLKDLSKLKELLSVVVKFSSNPVSLKTRIGFKKQFDLIEFQKIINNSGIEFLTLHARTVDDRLNDSTLDLDVLKKLKELISIPLIGNGDIINPRFAKIFLDYTHVDAIMIGRGSMGNPEIFYQIHEYLTNGKEIPFKNNLELMRKYLEIYENMINEYLDGVMFKYPKEEYRFIELKRNSIWLTKSIDNSTDIRTEISKTKNLNQLKMALENIFNG
jgi:tRNA-dihydrouridine synthase B